MDDERSGDASESTAEEETPSDTPATRDTGGDDTDAPVEVGDSRKKHVSVLTEGGEQVDHGDTYLKHSNHEFIVSSDPAFEEDETTRYRKDDIRRVDVTQHHSSCFITTAVAGDTATLDALRGFRDEAMVRSRVGGALVGAYERVSPPIAATLASHPTSLTTRVVRWLVRRCARAARVRGASDSKVRRRVIDYSLIVLYVVGVFVGLVGHWGILVRESLAAGRVAPDERPSRGSPPNAASRRRTED